MSRARPRIGVSSCLLGNEVRYDGGHKRDAFVVGHLARLVTLVPVCPEVEIGLGTPREPVRLVRIGESVHLVATRSGKDHTEAMARWAARRVAELQRLDLSGCVLKKDSPSCGMERVRVYSAKRAPARNGRGLFAAALTQRMPLLPVEEESRLGDPLWRMNFIERVFAYRRLKELFSPRWRPGDLVQFHTVEKSLLLAHDPAAYRQLGRLVAEAKTLGRDELARRYGERYMRALAKLSRA
jgi:uncharacterized protein YbbK (DUF523 family)